MSAAFTAPKRAYTFKEGLAMVAAKEMGIDPYLAAAAGDDARGILASLRKAKASKGADKAKHLAAAQSELRKLSPKQHGKLINALQAKLLALQGRGGDTAVAHLAPGEMVIPRSMQTPALMKQITALAAQRGINPAQLSVGHRANNVNPKTGQREFALEGWRKIYWQGGRDEARDAEQYEGIDGIDVIGRRDPTDFLNLYRGGEFAFNDQNVMRDANNDEIFKYGNGALTGPPSILKVPTKDELENMPDDQLKQRTELLKGIEQGVLFAGIPLTIVAVAGLVFYSNPVTGAIVGVLSALVAAQLDQVTDAYQAECASRKLC